MIDPAPCSAIIGIANLHPKKTLSKLTSWTFFQTSSPVETTSAPNAIPALFNSILSFPNLELTCSRTSFQDTSEDTS